MKRLLPLLLLLSCAPKTAPLPQVAPAAGVGEAWEWVDFVSIDLAPEGFHGQLRALTQQCGATGLTLLDVDCTEPPCLGIFRARQPGAEQALLQCPQWRQQWGRAAQRDRRVIDCGDGIQEDALLLGPTKVLQWLTDPAPDDPENLNKRLRLRAGYAVEDWSCARGRAQGLTVAPDWEDAPPELGPAGFPDALRDAVDQCKPQVTVLDIDCQEPPCLAVLQVLDPKWRTQLVERCPPWQETFGPNLILATDQMRCAESTLDLAVVGSARTWDHIDRPAGDDALDARMQLRLDRARADIDVQCR